MKYANFEFGKKNLIFYLDDKVILESFKPENSNRIIRYFKKRGFENYDKNSKIISRSGIASIREPFEIEPWNQIMIDDANLYGTLIDINKGKALNGELKNEDILIETKLSVAKLKQENLIWVARSQMVCHPDSLIYGEIDEIWYDQEKNIYYVGDTKTSSSVDKLSYWYQLAIYTEILRKLNPNKNISSTVLIDWVKIKTEKWVADKDFDEVKWKDWIGKQVKSTDLVYNSKWKKEKIEKVIINKLVSKNIEITGILDLAQKDIDFIKKYQIISKQDLDEKLSNNFNNIVNENRNLQTIYDSLKSTISIK